jgi:hypothetical protein
MTREFYAFRGQPVDMGRADQPLAVSAQFGMAEVIGKNVDDVGRR